MLPDDVWRVTQGIQDWSDTTIRFVDVIEGLANRVWRVNVNGVSYAVRIPRDNRCVLGSNIAYEIENSRGAAVSGVGPRVVYACNATGVMVSEWIDGTPQTLHTLKPDKRVIDGIVSTLRRLHTSEPFRNRFNSWDLIQHYVKIVPEWGKLLPSATDTLQKVRDVVRVLDTSTSLESPCHNDAMPKNWIVSREGEFRLVDFEYSGQNDPAFDLATVYNECRWNRHTLFELCDTYYSENSQGMSARVWLQSIVVDCVWAFYALVQASTADNEDRFISTAHRRWGRVCRKVAAVNLAEQKARLESFE